MRKRYVRAGLLVTLISILLAGCGWGPSTDGSLVVTIGDLPEGITNVTVSVTGDGMEPVSGVFTGDPSTSDPLVIPEGTGRQWTAVVDVDNATPVTQYTAEGTADIVGGEITEVTAQLYVSGSAVIVVDEFNGRLVMLDGPNGDEENWSFSSNDVLGLVDAEIGPDGFIYVLYVDNGERMAVEKLTSFSDTSRDRLNDNVPSGPSALAIDHPNRIIYYASSETLRSRSLAGGTETEHTPALGVGSNIYIFGLSADNSGNVYIVYESAPMDQSPSTIEIAKFDPNPNGGAGVIVNSVPVAGASVGVGNGFDVLWKAGKVYVADSSTNTIAVFPDDLSSQTNIGSAYPNDESPVETGEFVGPSLFAGHGNASIYVLDDEWDLYDAVVDFADDTFGSWRRRAAPGIPEPTEFQFWLSFGGQ